MKSDYSILIKKNEKFCRNVVDTIYKEIVLMNKFIYHLFHTINFALETW